LFGSDSARRIEAWTEVDAEFTVEKETRRKLLAGRDEYGGSNVLWYSSNSQPGSVYAGTRLDRAAVASE